MAILQGSIQVWSKTAAQWTADNTILLNGQWGHESDSLPSAPKVKIGDGVTTWNALSYLGSGGGGGTWGTITGTLSNQTDLNTALGLKAPIASPAFTGPITLTGKDITFNKGGGVPPSSCGIVVEESGVSAAFFITTGNTWSLKTRSSTVFVRLNSNLINSHRDYEWPNSSGTFITTGNLSDITSVAASIALTGAPTAPTPTPGDNDTSIATTAFVTAAITAATGGGYIKADGTVPLTNAWNAGAFAVTHNSVIVGSAANTIALGSASGGSGLITSTSHATKGFTSIGSTTTFTVDEVNKRLGVGTATPTYDIHVEKSVNGEVYTAARNTSSGSSASCTGYYLNNAASFVAFGITSSAYATSGLLTASLGLMSTTATAGILIAARTAATPIIFAIGGFAASNEIARITPAGLGIGLTPSAYLTLKAGTATANTAPLKLTAGTNLATPENGAIEFDGTNIFITVGGVRKTFTIV